MNTYSHTTAVAANSPQSPPPGDRPPCQSLSWLCAFCGRVRIFEGGRPLKVAYLDTCATCGSLIEKESEPGATPRSGTITRLG
jgi:hypothetical protein